MCPAESEMVIIVAISANNNDVFFGGLDLQKRTNEICDDLDLLRVLNRVTGESQC